MIASLSAIALPLADDDTDKGSPIGLLVVLLLLVAVYFLYRSMSRHMKRIPTSFDPVRAGDNTVTGDDAVTGGGPSGGGGPRDDGSAEAGSAEAGSGSSAPGGVDRPEISSGATEPGTSASPPASQSATNRQAGDGRPA